MLIHVLASIHMLIVRIIIFIAIVPETGQQCTYRLQPATCE